MSRTPTVSLVVACYDMERELPRTLLSLQPPYQRGLQTGDVEILVADNGSTRPLDPALFASLPVAPRVFRFEGRGPSPVRAINATLQQARADTIGVVIDGARMATPGVLALGLSALRMEPEAFVATLGFHLGPKTQQVSTTEGYTREVEDGLLASIAWPEDGYRLFDIAAAGESAARGVLAPLPETNLFLCRRATLDRVGGFDERFVSLGGGFVNHALMASVRRDPQTQLVVLLGEGTFHQLHYGATTQPGGIRRLVSEASEQRLQDVYRAEYERVIGEIAIGDERPLLLLGSVSDASRRFFFPGT